MKHLAYPILALAALATGCTAAIQDKVRGDLASLDPADVRIEVASARIVQVFTTSSGEWFKAINICLRKTVRATAVSYHTVDLLYPQSSLPPYQFTDSDGVLTYRASDLNMKSGCDVQELYYKNFRPVVLKELSVLPAAEGKSIALSTENDEAVYVSYEQNTVHALGFVAARPFFASRYNFNIDLQKTGLYTEYKGRKPYLLLLTPITALADVAAGAVFIGVMSASCNSHPHGCK